MNRIGNAGNRYQGSYKRVLCVCSAGLLRSPTAALVLSQDPFNYNTRAVGISNEYALIPLESVHLHWADEIVTMEKRHAEQVRLALKNAGLSVYAPPVYVLDIPDNYTYRDPELMKMIAGRYVEVTANSKEE